MKKVWQSKTMIFNALVIAVVTFCKQMNIEIPDGATEGILALGNMVLRLITKESVTVK